MEVSHDYSFSVSLDINVTDEVVKLCLGLFVFIKFLPLLNPFQADSQRNILTTQQELKFFYFNVLSFCNQIDDTTFII